MPLSESTWGKDERIQGGLANVGYRISDTTVGNVLIQHDIEPAPDQQYPANGSVAMPDVVFELIALILRRASLGWTR